MKRPVIEEEEPPLGPTDPKDPEDEEVIMRRKKCHWVIKLL